jgi:hypothetical protein
MFGMSLGIGPVSPLFRLGRIGISPGMNRLNPLFIGMSFYDGTHGERGEGKIAKIASREIARNRRDRRHRRDRVIG